MSPKVTCSGCGAQYAYEENCGKCPLCGKRYDADERGIGITLDVAARSIPVRMPARYTRMDATAQEPLQRSNRLRFDEADGGYKVSCASMDESGDPLIIPESYRSRNVTEIADGGFRKRRFLSEVQLPETLVRIGTSAFEGCENLSRVTGGENVRYIAHNAFRGCIQLEDCELLRNRGMTAEADSFAGCYHLDVITNDAGSLS